jgi:F-type H+-transporting ATPase subunit c
MKSKILSLGALISGLLISMPAFAEATEAASTGGLDLVGIGAGLAIGLVGLGGALGQGRAVSSGLEAIGRNPSAAGKVLTPMILGLVFIEVMVVLAFVIALGLTDKI